MSDRSRRIAKLLGGSVPLVLNVDDGKHQLELKLAWTMRAALLIESRLRASGVVVNVLQDIRGFWTDLDCTRLTAGVWATSLQENPEYSDDEGFEVIASFITPDNYGAAVLALKEAFLESLSPARRAAIKEAESIALSGDGAKDPTPAPPQD